MVEREERASRLSSDENETRRAARRQRFRSNQNHAKKKHSESRFWDKVVDSLHDRFDLRRVGGSAFYRRHKRLMNEFSSMADDVLMV